MLRIPFESVVPSRVQPGVESEVMRYSAPSSVAPGWGSPPVAASFLDIVKVNLPGSSFVETDPPAFPVVKGMRSGLRMKPSGALRSRA